MGAAWNFRIAMMRLLLEMTDMVHSPEPLAANETKLLLKDWRSGTVRNTG